MRLIIELPNDPSITDEESALRFLHFNLDGFGAAWLSSDATLEV